ncbi:MAG: hypothetical protein GY860_26140, partial [Desulfobacteraceae bacterium]|nr:hypothetical protein [Desulfobacteraceae bacterium]
FQLYSMAQGDPLVQVSMYEVGENLGLEKAEAGALAQTLFSDGHAELKTLAGGICITRQGLKALDMKIDYKGDEDLQLGSGPVLETRGKESLEKILGEIKEFIGGGGKPYLQLEEMVMDIKTIEIQMLSPHPKTGIIREVLKSMALGLPENEDLKGKLDALAAS